MSDVPVPRGTIEAPSRPTWDTVAVGLAAGLGSAALALVLVAPQVLDWPDGLDSVGRLVAWMVAAATDAQFHLTVLGGVLMMAGALTAGSLARQGRRCAEWAGFPTACGTGRLSAMLVASLLSLGASTVVWGWVVTATGAWQPLFVAFVSVPAAFVITYGTSVRSVLTGASVGVVLTSPVALLVQAFVCAPLGLSGVVSATTGMWSSALISFGLCHRTGWLRPMPVPTSAPGLVRQDVRWWCRRVLADFTEPQFFGNEWAGAGLLVGLVVTGLVWPQGAVYGSGLWLTLLLCQVSAAGLGVLLWRGRWRTYGWYPTFVPIVSLVPAVVLQNAGSPLACVAAVVVGASVMPPLAAAIGRRMPHPVHPFAGYVMAMTLCCATLVPLAKLVLPGAP